ncbi:MAG TPA: HAD family hydrolase [Blastocatellia bacterium]|nr:HAD family hydrolase [Blastocatellia bacterium]
MRPETIFLDRDGVINRRLPDDYVKSWAEFEFLPRAKEALRLFAEAGLRLVIVTNQRGVARGLMTEADLREIHERMLAELAAAGARVTAIYYCPHDSGQCFCRKPQPGLLLRARQDFPEIDFARSVMIGDSPADLEAGRRAGCRTFFITGDPEEVADAGSGGLATDGAAPSLFEAAIHYLKQG